MSGSLHNPDFHRPFGKTRHAVQVRDRYVAIIFALDEQDRAKANVNRPADRVGLVETPFGAQGGGGNHAIYEWAGHESRHTALLQRRTQRVLEASEAAIRHHHANVI